MFTTCVYCQGALGANAIIEAFPVGRRLAFDSARGRLWVVCPACARWNLSPLEERWEAMDHCERLYRDTPRRVSTDQIGLAVLTDGTRLVRVGAPSRPEFAAWRYGDEFVRRRRRSWGAGLLGVVAVGGSIALDRLAPGAAASLPLVGLAPQLFQGWSVWRGLLRPVARVPYGDGTATVRVKDLSNIRLEPDAASRAGWRLDVLHGKGRSVIDGTQAERVLGRLLAGANQDGASRSTVNDAVRLLADAGSAEQFLRRHARQGAGLRGAGTHKNTEPADVIALEMALHEDTERAALEGDLAALEAAWQEAEAIAAIADSLFVPDHIAQRLHRWRTAGRGGAAPVDGEGRSV